MRNDVEFDDLDIKCLTELPLIMDVIASTVKKIQKRFELYYSDLEDIIKQSLTEEWNIDNKKAYKNRTIPFSASYEASTEINNLEQAFQIRCNLQLKKKIGDNTLCSIRINFGYWMDYTGKDFSNVFFFMINNETLNKTPYLVVNKLEFYNKIESDYPDYEYDFTHPENDEDDEEYFEIETSEFSLVKIDKMFEVFKNEVIIPTLATIKQKTEL